MINDPTRKRFLRLNPSRRFFCFIIPMRRGKRSGTQQRKKRALGEANFLIIAIILYIQINSVRSGVGRVVAGGIQLANVN
jgi:hypothetical protein